MNRLKVMKAGSAGQAYPGMKGLRVVIGLLACSLLSACLGIPERAEAVDDFSLPSYLGSWYEIARLDHGFERGLSHVTAQYSMREDGGVSVLNKGFNKTSGQWKEADGKAYFIGDENVGRLKVSFFGPFYGAYNIIALAPDYQYAMIVGPDTGYFWILSRTPELDSKILQGLLDQARSLGVAVDELIYPEQDDRPKEDGHAA